MKGKTGRSSKRHPVKALADMLIASLILFAAPLSFSATAGAGSLARHKAVSITGWVSDAGCGVEHSKPGGASCVRKCIAGGASIGHPEWKPQKMVFVDDVDRSIWIVENPAALGGDEGRHVRITTFLNAKRSRLRVATVDSILE